MNITLKQAAQQAIEAFDAFGDADDFATIFALTQKMNALRTAFQQAESEPVAWQRRDRNIVTGKWCEWREDDDPDEELDPKWGERRPLYTHPAPGVQVAWNSIQIASWIGSQLMHEPSVFERAAVCKFVRSLGRHPTLLKHSPKIHPATSVSADVARDAISAVREQYRGTDWGKAAEGICDAIDAAMIAASPAQKGGE